jgi:hypothetical protein
MKSYTFELYKTDRRTKEGRRLVRVFDMEMTDAKVKQVAKDFQDSLGLTVVVQETYVERTSAMDGKKFMERYDTPYFCSPSSERFWTM